MRRFLLSLVMVSLWLAFLGASARAGEVEDRQAKIARLSKDRARLETTQKALEQTYQKKLADAEKAARSRAFNAEAKKADAHATGKKLSDGQAKIARVGQDILGERRALVVALEKAVAANPTDARLGRLLASEKAKLPAPVKKIKVADERIDPLDDPEDLDEKAARLQRSENELLREIERAEKRAVRLSSQAKLDKSRRRSSDDMFHDGQKGRKSAHGESRNEAAGVQGDRDEFDGSTGGGGGAPAPEEPAPGAGAVSDGESNGPTPTPAGTTPVGVDVAIDLTTQYSGVIDRNTLDKLHAMERSSDPETRARAAQELSAVLKARAERVKEQRRLIEKRAKQLRGR
jgi:hypothetical protein